MNKKKSPSFNGKLGLQQRVLPTYRVPFFQKLASKCDYGLSLFAGQPRLVEAINTASEIDGVDLISANNRHLFSKQFYICNQTNIINWLEESKPDVLVVEANPRYPSTHKAIEWMHVRSKKVLGWGLGAPEISGRFKSYRTKQRLSLLSKLDGLISYSERGAKQYIALGIPEEKVFVAHNAVSPRPTSPPPLRADEKAGTMKILFVGRLQKRKKLDNLFRACAQLEDKPELTIVGDGPNRLFFELYAAKAYPRANFVGAQHGKKLKQYFAEADIFVLPGTGGLAVQEAMSNGLPVIVAKGDGTQDDLVRPENGWQIPPDDHNALVKTLKMAFADIKRLRKMGAESFRITLEEININTMSDKFISTINAVTQGGK